MSVFLPSSLWICESGQVLSVSSVAITEDTVNKILPYAFSNSQPTVYAYVMIYANLTLSVEIAHIQTRIIWRFLRLSSNWCLMMPQSENNFFFFFLRNIFVDSTSFQHYQVVITLFFFLFFPHTDTCNYIQINDYRVPPFT